MKVQITIRGRRYTVRSDEDDVDLRAVAAYVDGHMDEVAKRSSTFDDYTVAMLAALNIASEFERFRRQVDGELGDLDRDLASVSAVLQASVPEEEG
jgi:cell division protein ZapA (FtsZ GTPase activity inhibitor)